MWIVKVEEDCGKAVSLRSGEFKRDRRWAERVCFPLMNSIRLVFRSRPLLASAVALLLILASGRLLADTIELKDGTTMDGKVLGKFKSKSGQTVMFRTSDGETKYIDSADIVSSDASTRSESPSKAPPRAAEPGAKPSAAMKSAASYEAALAKVRQPLQGSFKRMEQRKLAPWPDRPRNQPVSDNDPKGMNWKIIKKDGSVEFSETSPPNSEDYREVWCKHRPAVHVIYEMHGSLVSDNNTVTWGRMYWSDRYESWGQAHPNQLAFKEEHDAALSICQTLERAIDPEKASLINKAWYKMLNARAGSGKTQEKVAGAIQSAKSEMRKLTAQLDGAGNDLWRIREQCIKIDPKISPDASQASRIAGAKARRSAIEALLKRLYPESP